MEEKLNINTLEYKYEIELDLYSRGFEYYI